MIAQNLVFQDTKFISLNYSDGRFEKRHHDRKFISHVKYLTLKKCNQKSNQTFPEILSCMDVPQLNFN